MTAALKTALREACAELRGRNHSAGRLTPDAQIEAWERLADEQGPAPGEPFEAWRARTLEEHRDANVSPEQPIVDRDIKPEAITRAAADIRAEMYELPPYSGPGLKHGPGGTGGLGPCDADCRKCMLLAAEIAALQEGQQQHDPAGGSGPAAAEPCETWEQWRARMKDQYCKSAQQAVDQAWADVDPPTAESELRCWIARQRAGVDKATQGVPEQEKAAALASVARELVIRAQNGPPHAPPPGHARLCCARLGSVWCTEPDGHAGECKGPEEREIQGGATVRSRGHRVRAR